MHRWRSTGRGYEVALKTGNEAAELQHDTLISETERPSLEPVDESDEDEET